MQTTCGPPPENQPTYRPTLGGRIQLASISHTFSPAQGCASGCYPVQSKRNKQIKRLSAPQSTKRALAVADRHEAALDTVGIETLIRCRSPRVQTPRNVVENPCQRNARGRCEPELFERFETSGHLVFIIFSMKRSCVCRLGGFPLKSLAESCAHPDPNPQRPKPRPLW